MWFQTNESLGFMFSIGGYGGPHHPGIRTFNNSAVGLAGYVKMTGVGGDTVLADPLFLRGQHQKSDNFRLGPGSSAFGAGMRDSTATDFVGVHLPYSKPDIGAYQSAHFPNFGAANRSPAGSSARDIDQYRRKGFPALNANDNASAILAASAHPPTTPTLNGPTNVMAHKSDDSEPFSSVSVPTSISPRCVDELVGQCGRRPWAEPVTAAETGCRRCTGRHQHALRVSECSADDVRSFCSVDWGPAADLHLNFSILGRAVEHRSTGFLDGIGEGGGPSESPLAGETVNWYSEYTFSVPDELVAPLKPFGWRLSGNGRFSGVGMNSGIPSLDNVASFSRMKALGVREVQILLQETPFPPNSTHNCGEGCDPSTVCVPVLADGAFNCSAWEAVVRRALELTADWDDDILSFDVWNEMDSLSWPQFLATWRAAVKIIKAARPAVRVVGPSIGMGPLWPTEPGSRKPANYTAEFLAFCRDNDVLPDVFSWHDNIGGYEPPGNPQNVPPKWIGNGSEVVANVAMIRALMLDLNIDGSSMKFSVNEFMSSWGAVPAWPGIHVAFVANLERAGIYSAMKSCWMENYMETPADQCDSCSSPMLDGLLTCGGGGRKDQGGGGGVKHPQPRSAWWALKKAGDMSGRYVLPIEFDPQSPIAGIGSSDCSTRKLTLLLGYFPSGAIPAHRPDVEQVPVGPSRNVTISLEDLPACLFSAGKTAGVARVLYEYSECGLSVHVLPRPFQSVSQSVPQDDCFCLQSRVADSMLCWRRQSSATNSCTCHQVLAAAGVAACSARSHSLQRWHPSLLWQSQSRVCSEDCACT